MSRAIRWSPCSVAFVAAFVAMAWCGAALGALPAAAIAPPWRVVILHGSDGQLPASVLADTAFRAVLSQHGATQVEIFPEDLDTLRFSPQLIDAELVALLRKKHSARPPHLVVAFSNIALAFAERHHGELWPEATLIFMGVNEQELAAARGAHAATGVVVHRATAKSVELGLRLLPRTRRIVLVGGVSDWDRGTMAVAKEQMAQFEGRLELEYLENMPYAQILERVAQLREGTLLFPISMFRDSAGQSFSPAEAFTRMAETAHVPNLSVNSARMGRKLLGGYLIHYDDQGRQAGELALDIFAGRDPRSLPVRVPESRCAVDWGELERWKIPLDRVPPDCEVRFRVQTYWEQNRATILAAGAIILFQAFLIWFLMFQHRQRRRAEREAARQHSQLAHAARLATVGELTASIAHEINQPLGAILSNADAAEILLESRQPDLTEVRHILSDIRRDDERASAVIQRLRTLLARHELHRTRLDANAVAREAIALISQEAQRRGARVVESLASGLPCVHGDRVHLVQVMIILLVNALDAMEEMPAAKRQVIVSTAHSEGRVEMAVADSGPGIPAADFSRLFDSFFTTKAKGMGLGLSIARSIVEAHGGRIWAGNPAGGGAVFHFSLAAAR